MQDDYISHYGVKRRSGRYPWGSGERPYQSDPQKARLQRRYERIESKATQKRDSMLSKGKSEEKISDYVWRTNNTLDDISRKLARLSSKKIAESMGIADKKISNAMADYEWGKKLARQYAYEGRPKNKLDSEKLKRGGAWVDLYSPSAKDMVAAIIYSNPVLTKAYALKGSEYYDAVSKEAAKILHQRIPGYLIKREIQTILAEPLKQ